MLQCSIGITPTGPARGLAMSQEKRIAMFTKPGSQSWTSAIATNPAAAYAVDFWQRSILYADVMRERGNQYLEHMEQAVPNVLHFEAEPVMSGADLPRPVNYRLVRIVPPEGIEIDPLKRPFVVVDPRAGHGPGIGGFKAESEVGVALNAGHACYFVGFLPDPVPGQSVEDVMRAEAAFLERVISLHPESEGKPVVIGNCQAGWQLLMTAAVRPELFGPIIVAGAPLSYWAGWPGKNPMRYAGGLLGGSWLTQLTSDIGAGRFDGAWLVQNFENLNPANTLWTKQYNVFSKVDTEAPRYLGFEKYWGGHVFLDSIEMQYLVDNLFIGNRLSTAELVTSDGIRIDLRNIRSPILVFCSEGDNITPPPQALGWITDLYRDEEDVRAHDQTIIYCVHDSIGHLGIFVSGSVGRKEHQEFSTNIEFLSTMPSGIYEAELHEKGPDTINPELAEGDWVLSLEKRKMDDVRKIVAPDEESDRRFATVSRVSQANLNMYRTFLQPWVRAMTTPATAEMTARLHPLRLSYELMSDHNPWMAWLAPAADRIREQRQPLAADNPFLQTQEIFSTAIENALDHWREARDTLYERTFEAIYGNPWIQAAVGIGPSAPPRQHPGETPEHRAFLAATAERLREEIAEGGLLEATIRALIHIHGDRKRVDERSFNLIRKLRQERATDASSLTLSAFKEAFHRQTAIMRLEPETAVAALPELLKRAQSNSVEKVPEILERIMTSSGPLDEAASERLRTMQTLFRKAAADSKIPRGPQVAAAAPAKPPRQVQDVDADTAKPARNKQTASIAAANDDVAAVEPPQKKQDSGGAVEPLGTQQSTVAPSEEAPRQVQDADAAVAKPARRKQTASVAAAKPPRKKQTAGAAAARPLRKKQATIAAPSGSPRKKPATDVAVKSRRKSQS